MVRPRQEGLAMPGTAAVLVCALELLGKTSDTLAPVKLLALPPPHVSGNAEGFVRFRRVDYLRHYLVPCVSRRGLSEAKLTPEARERGRPRRLAHPEWARRAGCVRGPALEPPQAGRHSRIVRLQRRLSVDAGGPEGHAAQDPLRAEHVCGGHRGSACWRACSLTR